ncbi:MAG: proton-conducting transporter membrane subunit [Hydrogenothermaceae bacterium]
MIFVILSKNIFSFLLFWELMSGVSFLLVLYDYKEEENVKSGIIYFIMTHIGTVFIILSFGIFYYISSSTEFYNWENIYMDDNLKFLIFLFGLIGFGTKAGLFPFHIWLPKAHPVTPSNISALMSGVMLKVAVFMLVQYFFVFLNNYPVGFGFLVLAVGSITAVYGILYGYVSNDIKKLLAYSSMENIGIIVMAMGIAMIFKSYGVVLLAGIGFIAMLYHTLNHAVFKSLLFMSSGVILLKARTKSMDKLGGLIKSMPITSILTLIGILGITALPPFNGFVSE